MSPARTTCAWCNKGGGKLSLSRCGGCKSVSYCSAECQRTHWKKGHKQECAAMTRDFIVVRCPAAASPSYGLNGNIAAPWTGGPPSGRSVGEEFVVKIQLPGEGYDRTSLLEGSVRSGKLLVYDKTRTLLFYFDGGECPRLEELASKIQSDGWGKPNGVKAFMPARVSAEGALEVFWRRLQPSKSW